MEEKKKKNEVTSITKNKHNKTATLSTTSSSSSSGVVSRQINPKQSMKNPNKQQCVEDEENCKSYMNEIVDYLNDHKGQIGIIYVLSRQEAGMNNK